MLIMVEAPEGKGLLPKHSRLSATQGIVVWICTSYEALSFFRKSLLRQRHQDGHVRSVTCSGLVYKSCAK